MVTTFRRAGVRGGEFVVLARGGDRDDVRAPFNQTHGREFDGARAARRMMTFTALSSPYHDAQVVTNVPGTVLRAMTALGRQKPSIGLACAHVVAKTSQGLIHACIFIVAHPKRKELRGGGANAGAARFLPRGWSVDGDDGAQTGGRDSNVVDDVDLASDEEDEGGFVALGTHDRRRRGGVVDAHRARRRAFGRTERAMTAAFCTVIY